MSVNVSIPLNDANNVSIDANTTQVTGTGVSLKLIDNINQEFIQPFSSDVGFTYDSAKSEFVAGKNQQKDQRPANSIIGVTFTNSLNANWGADGFVDLSYIANGSPVLSGGKVSCPAGSNGVAWSDALIGNLSNDWVAKVKFTPNYSGAPIQNLNIFSLWNGVDVTDRIIIFHATAGSSLRITANGLSAVVFDVWSPTASQEYTFEIICIAGQVSLYIDNVQIGASHTIAPAVGTGNIVAALGAVTTVYDYCDGLFDDFILYSTTSQTPTYTIPEYSYLATKVELPQFVYPGLGSIQAFDDFTTIEGGPIRYVLNDLYWNGSMWYPSNGTYAQANDYATVVAHIATFPLSDTLDIDILYTDSNIQGGINNLVVEYTGQIYSTANPKVDINAAILNEGISNFIETIVAAGSDEITWILSKQNVYYYWDGAAWSISNETYAQSSTGADVLANIATFNISDNVSTKFAFFLHSDDGSSTPEAQNLELDYDFYAGEIADPSKCIVYGYVQDDGTPIENAKIEVTPNPNQAIYNNEHVQCIPVQTVYSDADGYWDVELVETDNMPGVTYTFTITCPLGQSKSYERQVPNVAQKNFAEL